MDTLLRRAQEAFTSSIAESTRSTYGTGQRAYDRFRVISGAPALGDGDNPDMDAAAFLAYAVTDLGVAPNTANSYLSHVIRKSIENRTIPNYNAVRTKYVEGVVDGLQRLHALAVPARETA